MPLLLLALYYSVYYVRPSEWVSWMMGVQLQLLVGVICILYIIKSVINSASENNINIPLKLIIGFVAAITLSHVSYGYFGGVIQSLNSFLPSIVGYLMIILVIDSKRKLDLFIIILILLSTFLAYEGWLQHTTGFAHGGIEPVFENNLVNQDGMDVKLSRIRWYGVFSDPNDLGLALIIVIPFLLNMALNNRFLLPIVSTPLIVSAIYFTNSRGTVLAALATICLYFFILYRSFKSIILGLLIVFTLFAFGPSRMASVSASDESSYGRIEAWSAGYQMLKKNPLFGIGQGNFTDYNNLTAHNSFVLVMAELGIAGLFFFTSMIYLPICWLWKNVLKPEMCPLTIDDLQVVSAVFASFGGMLVSMFFISRAYVLIPYTLMALCCSCVSIMSKCIESYDDTNNFSVKDMKYIAIITVLQIISINIIVKLFI